MNDILVPVDFSGNAFKAIAYAAQVAEKAGVNVHLLHVIEPTLNMATMQTDSKNKKILREKTYQLQLTIRSVRGVYPKLKIKPFLSGGKVIDAILSYAEKNKVGIIIMGTSGANEVKKILMGSVASGIVSKTKIPVLTVPATYVPDESKVVIFATNQFEKDPKILDSVIRLPKLFSSVIHVVVFRDVDGDKNADLIYNEEQLHDYLLFLRDAFPHLQFAGALSEGEGFETSMEQYSDSVNSELISMVSYPKSFFEKLLQKSTTKKRVLYSTRPILAVPAAVSDSC